MALYKIEKTDAGNFYILDVGDTPAWAGGGKFEFFLNSALPLFFQTRERQWPHLEEEVEFDGEISPAEKEQINAFFR